MSFCLCRRYYTLDRWCLFVCVGNITHLIDDVYLCRRYYTLVRWCLFVSVSNITHLIDDVCLSVQAILHTCSMMSLSVGDITHLIDDVCLSLEAILLTWSMMSVCICGRYYIHPFPYVSSWCFLWVFLGGGGGGAFCKILVFLFVLSVLCSCALWRNGILFSHDKNELHSRQSDVKDN